MIVTEILQILKEDSSLKELIKATVADTKIYLNNAVTQGDCIIYKYIPLTNDSIKIQSRLELDCISKDYEKSMQILKRVQQLLLTIGDDVLTDNLIEVNQNGGGYVFDKEIKVHKFKAIFILKEKVR